jgi:hypothetical protein
MLVNYSASEAKGSAYFGVILKSELAAYAAMIIPGRADKNEKICKVYGEGGRMCLDNLDF